MKTAIIGIKFKDEAKQEDIEEAVSNFFAENDNLIKGMTYLELKEPGTFQQVYDLLSEKERDEKLKVLGKI